VRLLGDPIFLEDYRDGEADVVFFLLGEGVEGELMLGRASHFQPMHVGPYTVLLDRTCLLDGYEKVEQAVPVEQLAPLAATCCPLERDAMLQAAFVIVRYFQDMAAPLARQYGLVYPAALEQILYARLEALRHAP
jgi:hypothetical protein